MKTRKYLIPLIALLSIWMVFFPAYVHSCNLAQADFLARPHWENPYQDGLLAGLSKRWEIIGWNASSLVYDQDYRFFELLRHLSLPKLCPAEKILILRC
jgi:hypothetical protein